MRLTFKALQEVKRSKRLRARLALALNKSEFSIQRYIKDNAENLTLAAAMAVIREETGLSDDEILENEPELKGAA